MIPLKFNFHFKEEQLKESLVTNIRANKTACLINELSVSKKTFNILCILTGTDCYLTLTSVSDRVIKGISMKHDCEH